MAEDQLSNEAQDLELPQDPIQETSVPESSIPEADPPVKKSYSVPKEHVDFYGLTSIYGNSDADVFEMQKTKPQKILSMMPKEEAFKHYSEEAKRMGLDWTPEKFEQDYSFREKQYANYKKGVFDHGTGFDHTFNRSWSNLFADMISPYEFNPSSAWVKVNPLDTQFIHEDGELKRVKTKDESMYDLGFVLTDIQGDKVKNVYGDYVKNERKYKEIEIGGRKMRVLDLEAHKDDFFNTSRNNPGPEGNTVLVASELPDGTPAWKEETIGKISGKVHSDEVASVYGPRSMRQSWHENLWMASLPNAAASIQTSIVGFADYIKDAFGYGNVYLKNMTGGIGSTESISALYQAGTPDWLDKADKEYRDHAAWMKPKAPENVRGAGAFDSAQSFAWSGGAVAGELIKMIAARNFSSWAGKTVGMTQMGAAKLGGYMGSGTMAISAADQFKQSMIDNGISEDNQFLLYGPALVSSFFVERLGGNILDDGLKSFYAKQNVKKYVDEGIQEQVKLFGLKSASEMSKEQVRSTGKVVWNKIFDASKSMGALGVKAAGVAEKYAPISIKAAWEEGMEEAVEGRIYTALETIHDMHQAHDARMGKDLDRYTYSSSPDEKNFYEVDRLTGIKRKISSETYEKMSSAQKIKPGNGMFGEYNPELGLISNWTNRATEGLVEDFVLGAFAGGLMTGAGKLTNGKDAQKEKTLQDYVVRGNGDIMRSKFAEMHEKGLFGPTDINTQDKVHNPQDENSLSLNDMGYQTALKELEEAELTFKLTGLEGDALKEMMESEYGHSLLKEAYNNVGKQRDLQSEIDDINKEMSETTDPQLIKNLQEKITDKTRLKEDLNIQLGEIRSGDRMIQSVSDYAIKDWSSQNNTGIIDPNGNKVTPGIAELKNVSDRYDSKKAAEIEKINEAKSKRVQLENEVGSFSKSKIDPLSAESNVFEKISDIQIKASEVGLSESGTKSMMDKLQGIRKDILRGIDQFFTAEQITEAETSPDEEALMTMAKSGIAGSDAEKIAKTYDDLDRSIKSFNVDKKPEIKKDDFVQWTQSGQSQFDQPRKVTKISDDGEFGFVEGSDTGIPISQLHDPNYTGGRVRGSIPESFDESTFKRNFYDTYIDTQGNEVSINQTMSDLASRKMNSEDEKTIELLNQAISNNDYLANVNHNVLKDLSSSKDINLGKYKPSDESILNDDEYKAVINDLADKKNRLRDLSEVQKKDANNKKNREGKLRYNDYKMRNDILVLASNVEHISLDSRNEIARLKAQISEALDLIKDSYSSEKQYKREYLDQVDPLLVKAETILHYEFNGDNRIEIIEGITAQFKQYKGYGPYKSQIYHNASEFVMHDFENVFDYSSFSEQVVNNGKSKGAAFMANIQFANTYFTNHLQTIDRLDPKRFFDFYANSVAGLDLESGQVPSYEQIKSIYHTTAFMSNQKTDLLWKVQDILTGAKNEKSKEMHFNRALFLRGFAGTGKTSLVIKYASNIFSDMNQRDLVIDVVAPSTELQKSLSSNLVSFRSNSTNPSMDYYSLVDHILNPKSTIDKTDLIIIDEASNLSKSQLKDLRTALSKSRASKRLSVIFLGDQSQMTSVNSTVNELVAVERIMERTMPTTEVFRSGAADISNLQNSFRSSTFQRKEAILPKGTYDKEKNNGLHYFGGTKKEMYDQFISDLNDGGDFKKNNTALIVYKKSDREAAMNYVRKALKDGSFDLDSKIKTIEEGEFSAQGLGYGRIYVAIDQADAAHLYNPAMLTAISRAKRIDDEHNGFASVLSTRGFSQEGSPLIVETKTASAEDIERHKSWVSSIIGMPVESSDKAQKEASSTISDVTSANFNSLKSNLSSILGKGKIEFTEGGFIADGLRFRYKIKNKPVQSVTQKLSSATSQSETDRTLDPHAKRGNAVHRIVEAHLLKQQKKGGKLFTKQDIDAIKGYVKSYNDQVAKWNELAKPESRLQTIDLNNDEATFETNKFIQDVISNVAIPIANKLNQGGKYSIPESVIGIYYNDIAGTIDIIDHVGMDGDIPVVDILDIKTLTPSAYKFFGDGNVESKLKLPIITSPTGETYAASGLNKALSQLATYKAMLENGDTETGFKPMKVRNVTIIKSSLTGANEVSSIVNDDFVTYDTESSDFKKFKDYGDMTVSNGVILQNKNTRNYDPSDEALGSLITTPEGSSVEVTGSFKDVDGNQSYELNNDINNPVSSDKFSELELNNISKEISEDPTMMNSERVYKRSAVSHSNGNTFSFSTASTSVDNGKPGYANDHFKFKSEFMKVIAPKMNFGSPNAPKVNMVFHPELQLLNDKGELQMFKNVVASYISEDSISDIVKAAKTLPWATGMTDAQIMKEIKDRNYLLLSTLPHPDSNFGKTERDIDYTDQAQVQKLIERIKNGFTTDGVADKFKPQLVQYHTDLVSYRSLGAKNPGEVFATVKLKGLSNPSVIYDGKQRSMDSLLTGLSAKGFKIGKPYFGSKLYQKVDANGKVSNIASWAVDVWRVSPSVDSSRIILRTGEFDDNHYSELKKNISDLRSNKALTHGEINQSLAMGFILQNRSFLIDPTTGKLTEEIPGLSNFIKVDGHTIDLNVDGKKTIPALIDSLSKAIDLLNGSRKSNNKVAKNLRQSVPFVIGDNNMRVIPSGMESKLFTSASDVHSFGIELGMSVVKTESETGVYGGMTSPSKSDEDLLKNMGIIDPNPNKGGIAFMEDIEEEPGIPLSGHESSSDPDSTPVNEKDRTFYDFATRYFGDIRIMNEIKKDVSRILIQNSNYNRDLNTPTMSNTDMLAKAWDHYSRLSALIAKDYSSIDVKSGNNHYTNLSEISGDTAHLLYEDKSAFSRYFNYAVGSDQELFFAIVDRALPNLNIKKMNKLDIGEALALRMNSFLDRDAEGVTEEEKDIMSANENSQTSVMDSINSRAFTDTLSGFVHLMKNHVKLKEYSIDPKTGDLVGSETGGYINPKTIEKSLVDSAQTSSPLKGDLMEQWVNNFLEIANRSGVGSPTYNHLMSFHDDFFGDQMSHKYLRDNAIRTGGESSLIEIKTGANPEIIKAKAKASSDLLSALYSHMVSVSSKKYIKMNLNSSGDKISRKIKTQSLAVGVQVVQDIKSRMNNALFSMSENGIEINPKVSELITEGQNQRYRINSSGVFDLAGGKATKLIGFTTQNGKIVDFVIPDGIASQDIKDLLNIINLKGDVVYTTTIKTYMGNESDSNPDPEKRRDRSKIAEIVGMFMLTTKNAVNPSPSETSLLDAYYKENGYTKDSLDDLNDDGTVDMEKTGTDIYKPTDLYRLIENLAKVQSEIGLNNHADFFYNVNGDKVYKHTNGNTFLRLFSNADVGDKLPTSNIKEYYKEFVLSDQNIENIIYNPNVARANDGKIKVLNTLMDPNSDHHIMDAYVVDGTEGNFKSVQQGKSMTDMDYVDFSINGMFVDDILSGKKIQNIRLPYHQISNKSAYVAEHNFGSNKFTHTENGIIADRAWINENISKIFFYHNSARRVSYLRWRNALVSMGFNVDRTTFEGWMTDPQSFKNTLSMASQSLGKVNKGASFNDFITGSTELVENRDYKIGRDGSVLPGNAPMMTIDSVYNWKNFNKLKEASAGVSGLTVDELIDSLFYKRHIDTASHFSRNGFKLDQRLNNNNWLLKQSDKKNAKGFSIWKVNPTLESYLYAWHIADHNLSQLTMGDASQYKDISDVIKRSSGPFAQSWRPDTSSPNGIGKFSNAVIIEDIQGETYEQLETIFGQPGNHVETDGLGIINPISLTIMKNSYGGEELGVIGKGMLKPVYFKPDMNTNDAVYFKYALLPLTQQVLENSSIARETFRKMVTPEMFEMWQSGKTFDEIADYVVENGLQQDMLMQAVFKSGNKTGNRGVQKFDSPEWTTSVEVDNDFFGIQLNPSQDVESTENMAGPSQLNATLGIGSQNTERVSALNELKAGIAVDALAKMKGDFSTDGNFDPKKFEDYLRKIGQKSSEKTGEITKFAEMLYDDKVDLNIPTQRTKLIQMYMNRITSDVISPRWNGVRMSQAPGFMFPIYMDVDGNPYMENEYKKYFGEPGPESMSRSLQPMKFYKDEKFINEITSQEEFASLMETGEVFVKPGDVIVPFSYFEKFGLKEYIDADPSFSLNDVFMVQLEDGNLANVRSMNEDETSILIDRAFDSAKDKKEEGLDQDAITFLQKKFSSASAAKAFIKEFREALQVIPDRIPTSSTSFGWIGEITGWINDNGNTVFTSAQKNILDGGDYDIDQLNIYFKFLDSNGKIVKGDSKQGKINQMFDLITEYYNDPKNAEIFMKRLSMEKLESQVEEIKRTQTKFKGHHNDFGTNIYYYDNIKQGDSLIGIFANIVKTFSYLSHVSTKADGLSSKVEINSNSLNSSGEYISNVLERFLNAAMDNVKESILGYLGATEDAGNLIGAAAIKGMDEIEIANLLKNDVVVDVFRKMKNSKRVTSAKKSNILDVIDSKIEDITKRNSIDLREDLEKQLKELKGKIGAPSEDEGIDDAYVAEFDRLQEMINDADNFEVVKQDQLDVLYRLKDLAYFGESISRLNSIIRIDSVGAPVFDYHIEKQIRDVEYNLGMPLDDFLAGKTGSSDWYKSRKTYLTFDDSQKLEEREPAIRSYLDLQKITKELPHIMAYLEALNEGRNNMKNTFIRNSKLIQDLSDSFLGKMKMDWFRSERSYYSFHNEVDNFFIATFFGTHFKGKMFQSQFGLTKGSESVNISTREGRYQFGIEFPTSVIEEADRIRRKPKEELTPRELDLVENTFLNSLTVNSTPSGDFLEFKNSWKLTEDDFRDLRASFKKLPAAWKEKFYVYQLAKDGFNFTKGGLYEAMDNELFRMYSTFLDKVKGAVDTYGTDKETPFDFIDSNGVLVQKTLSEIFDSNFLEDVGAMSDEMNLLPFEPREGGFEPHLQPDQHKVREKNGSFTVSKVKKKGLDSTFQPSSKKTFNGYDPLNSVLTTMDVIRKISKDTYKKLKSGAEATIRFNGKVQYKLKDAYIPDGTLVRIKSATSNSITVLPIVSTNPMNVYQSKTGKEDLLNSIVENSKNDLNSKLAKSILEMTDPKFLQRGLVNFTNEDADATFNDQREKGNKTPGYWDQASRTIGMNMSQIRDINKLEHVFLHEMIHDITFNAMEITDQEADSLGEKGQRIKEFKENIEKIYQKAKLAYTDSGEKHYGMKDATEFLSEAISNPEFQRFLSNQEIEESVGTSFIDKVKDLYRAVIGSIRNLLGISEKDAPYTMLDQVVGLVIRHAKAGDYDFKTSSNTSEGKVFFSEDSKPETEVNETKDIINSLQPDGFSKTYTQYQEEQLVTDIYNSIDPKTGIYYYNGDKFYFKSKEGEMMDELSAKNKIKNEVVPKFTEFETNYKNSVIGWLNNGAQVDGSLPATFFPKKGGTSRYSQGTLGEMRRLIDHDVNDFYVRYSELKNNEEFKDIPYIAEFEGFDPIVSIHKSIDGSNMSISIFDATSLRLNKKGILEGNIFKKHIADDYEARNKGVTLGNNEGDVRRLLLGLQVMAMKKANPDLKIKHVGVLGVSNKSIDSTWVFMEDFVSNVKAMNGIEAIMKTLPESIKDIVSDDSLHKQDYDQPWIFMLRRKFQQRVQDLDGIENQEFNIKKINDSVSQIDAYLNGQGSKDEVLNMMIHRMEEIQNTYHKDEELLNDKEYIYLSNTIREMSAVASFDKNGTKDLDTIKSFLTPTPDISHDIVNWAQEQIFKSMRIVQDKVRDFQNDKFVPILKDFNNRYFKKYPEQRAMDYLQDLSGKKFMPLFKTRKVKDQSGNDIEVNSMEIHWDMNDAETKEAIRTNKISTKDVEFGKFIVDTLEEQMIENILHSKRHDKGFKKEDAKKDLDRKWRRGMIPVMSSSVNEMLMKKDAKSAKAAYDKFFRQLTNLDDIYDEVDKQKLKDTKRQKILKEMTDFFMNQIGLDSDIYGSDARMKMMGLRNDITGPILMDSNTNENLSTNLELITMYMVSSSERKRVFDKKVLPYVNAAQTMLHNPQLSGLDGDQQVTKSYFQNYINSVLKGMPETTDSKILGVNVDAAISSVVQLASFNGLALNVPVAASSALMNAGQLMNSAIANDMATNGLYGKAEAMKAIKMFGTVEGRKFIESIMDMYKVADRTERDMMHNPRMKVTNKNIFTSHHAYWMNWYTDYNVRGIVAAAQMIKDGSIAAYTLNKKTGKLEYDESKDPNFKGETGEHFKNHIKQRLIEEGVMNSMDEKMPRGYDHKMASQLKHLADKHVVGNLDDATKGRFGRTVAAKPFMQFISWLPTKMVNYFGSTKASAVGGKYVTNKNEHGEAETVWEQTVQEGIFTTLKNIHSELRENKYKSMRSWSEMKPHERYNVTKLGIDLISFTVLYGLYAGLTGDWDDEEGDQAMVEDSRLMKVFKYSAMDYLAFNPLKITESLLTVPVLEQAERLSGIFIGDFSGVERSLPLSSTVRSFSEVLSDEEK
jgi:hypothetical protein